MISGLLRTVAALCFTYVALTILTWVVCLWVYIFQGAFLTSDQGAALVVGGLFAAVLVGGAGALALALDDEL